MRRRRLLRAAGATAGAALGAGVIGGPAGPLSAVDAANGRSDATTSDERPYGPLGSVELRGTREAVVSGDGRTASLALGDGYATVDVSDPTAPMVLAERRDLLAERSDGPLRGLNDAAVSGDRLIVVGPAHARDDVPSGVLVVDISDPTAPQESGYYETDFPIHNADFAGRHCYLTGNDAADNALVVVDVEAREEVARWSLLEADPAWRDVPSGIWPIHDVTVRDDVAALAYWDAGTYLLDVSTPSSPTLLGAVDPGDPDALRDPPPRSGVVPPGNHHVAVLAPGGDVLAVGRESWAVEHEGDLLGGPSGVDLYDVSDPAAPARLSSIAPPHSPDPRFGGMWTTAHNLDLTGDALYTSWYQGGVKRHDISDPADPVEETWWADPDATRFWGAVLAVSDEYFLAPSMGTRAGAPAGLWTFPDRAGVGGDRSRLDDEAAGTAAPPMTTSTLTETEATKPTVTGSDTAGGTETPSADSSAAAPGFGVASAVAGVGVGASVVAALIGRRRETHVDDGVAGDDAKRPADDAE
ncbi:LVIVD repeat-containing protein [Halobaculum gomorrense]|uniref:LVIVD repeat-containing protein n=1 Tax=Halobaculum gomorrense TaxID=43928 RepID=A0A1M5JX00_9EURY|nr:hypothetical protein [Halobaculum gomorrense]SHG44905.1 LVIVD repeat-containing protein [Halobaculum gomorrense]